MADQPPPRDRAMFDVTETASYDLPVSGERALELATVSTEHYTVIEEHARGGIGRVLRAEDLRLGRTVAVKELLRNDPSTEQRFLREARVTARLQHPAIVPIYEAGRWPDGRPFYAMRLIAGRPLKDLIDERPTIEERLALLPNVITITEAIAYAHQRRVIHRDLKPNNIVVGSFGETMLVDWGLAKELDAADDTESVISSPSSIVHTQEGVLMGTPAFMPPEQARRQPADERSDIYGLGAILYTMAAGTPPHADVPAAKIIETVAAGAPSVRSFPGVAEELATIIDKAMATSPADRYQNAAALAEDLKRFVAGQRVGAHRYSWWALAGRWTARHRTAVLLSLGFVALMLVGAAIALRRIVTERDHTRASYERLVLERARAALVEEPAAALAWLKNYPAHAADWTEARELALRALDAAPARHIIQQPRGIPAPHWTFSTDGTRGAALLAGDELGVWDVASGAVVARAKITEGPILGTLFISPDTLLLLNGSPRIGVWSLRAHELRWVATGASHTTLGSSKLVAPNTVIVATDEGLSLVPLDGGTPRPFGAWTEPVGALSLSPDGRMVLVGHGGMLTLLSAPDGARLHDWEEPCPGAGAISFSRDARQIAIKCEGGLRVLDSSSYAVQKLAFPSADVLKSGGRYDLTIAPDGKQVAIAGPDDGVRLWDVASGSLRLIGRHHALATTVLFMPSGDRLLSGGNDRTLRIWHRDGTLERVIAAGDNVSPDTVVFAPGGQFFSASGAGNAVRLWRTPDPIVMHPIYDGLWMTQSADGRSVLHTKYAWQLTLLDAHTGVTLAEVIAKGALLLGATLSPDARHAAFWTNASSAANELGIWDTATSVPKRIVVKSPLSTAAFTPDSSRIVALHKNGDVTTWTLDGELVATTALPAAAAASAASSGMHFARGRIAFADGGLAVVNDGSPRLHLFDWSRSRVVRSIDLAGDHGGGRVSAMALSNDRRSLVVTGPDRELRVVRLDGNGSVRSAAKLAAAPKAVALTPDAAAAAVSLEDGTVAVIDLATGAIRATLPRGDIVTDLTFSGDGRWLATGSIDSAVRLWSTSDWTLERLFAHDQTGGVRSVQFAVDGTRLLWTGHEMGLGSALVPAQPDVPPAPEKLLGWIGEQTSAVAAPGHPPRSP